MLSLSWEWLGTLSMGEVRGLGDILITGISILQVTQLLQSYMFNYHPDIGRAKGVQYKKMF